MTRASRPQASGSLSPEMALLGMLYAGPGHGYDLHRRVVSDLGQVWHLSQSQAYAILRRLAARGEITAKTVPQQKLPPRQILHMTSAGQVRFLAWLDAVSRGSTRAVRLEFLTRLYFLERHFPARIGDAFTRQEVEVTALLRRVEGTLNGLPADGRCNRLSLDLRARQLRCTLDWLADCRREFLKQ